MFAHFFQTGTVWPLRQRQNESIRLSKSPDQLPLRYQNRHSPLQDIQPSVDELCLLESQQAQSESV